MNHIRNLKIGMHVPNNAFQNSIFLEILIFCQLWRFKSKKNGWKSQKYQNIEFGPPKCKKIQQDKVYNGPQDILFDEN